MASVLLALPLLKHIWAWMGCGPADYAPTKALLQHTSVGLAPEVTWWLLAPCWAACLPQPAPPTATLRVFRHQAQTVLPAAAKQ